MIITTRFQPGNVVRIKGRSSTGTISSIEVFVDGRYIYHVSFNVESFEPTSRSYNEDELECIAYTRSCL